MSEGRVWYRMLRWNNSDNLHGVEALVVGGPQAGLRVVVSWRAGNYRHPDVLDAGYVFDRGLWQFVWMPL